MNLTVTQINLTPCFNLLGADNKHVTPLLFVEEQVIRGGALRNNRDIYKLRRGLFVCLVF